MGICLCPNSYNIVRNYFINIKQIYPQKTIEAIVPIDNNSVISTSQKEVEEIINSNIQFVDNKNNSQHSIESFQQNEGKSADIEKNNLEKINNNYIKSKTFLNRCNYNINDCSDDNGCQFNSFQILSKSKNSIKNIQINSLFINYKFGNKFHGGLETVYEAKSEMSNSKFESKNNSKNGNSKFSRKVSSKYI